MILRARFVATMNGGPIENGAVAIRDGKIAAVGKWKEIARDFGEIVDLGERVLLPGLINAHCHLDYTCLRDAIPATESFSEWIRAINAAKTNLTADDYVTSINSGFAEAKKFGTTTIANLTAFPELIRHIRPPIRACWFAELIDVRDPARADEIVTEAVENLEGKRNCGLAPHAPFTASPELYRKCREAAEKNDLLLTTHVAESREEMEMFRDARGPLFDLLQKIGRPVTSETGSPVSLFLKRTPLDERWLVVHLNELSATDFSLLESWPKFHIAHCPRSHRYFGHSPFEFEKLRGLGFNICLGTDSLASNADLCLFAEMREFRTKFPEVEPKEIVEMVTVRSAMALHQTNLVGAIRNGAWADLIAIPFCENEKTLYEQIVEFLDIVPWTMVDGHVTSDN